MEQKLLSIYIGKDVTRICEVVKKSQTSIVVNNATEVSTPGGSFDDGYLTDIPNIAEAIRGCVFGRGFSANKVVFTITSKKIANKEVVIPFVKGDKRIAQILEANSSEHFPMTTAGDFIFAHSIMETFQEDDGKKLRLTAVAAPRDLVECYYELADELRLTVENIDYVGNSVLQLLSLQMREGSTELVLQIEKDTTFVNIMNGRDIILQRSVPYGKNAVINSMMEIKKLTEKDAKTLLSNRDMLDRQVTEEEYAEAVRYLISSIGRIVEYHRSRNPDRIIDGIKVFGEGSAIAGIDEVLKQELGANVTHFSTLQGVKVSGKAYLTSESALRYLANFGAILKPIGLNLNRGKNKDRISKGADKVLLFIFVAGLLVSAVLCGWKLIEYFTLSTALELVESKIKSKEDIIGIVNDYNDAIDSYELIIGCDEATYNNNDLLLDLIASLEKNMPKDMRVNDIKSLDGSVTLTVQARDLDQVNALIVKIMDEDFVVDYLLQEIEVEEGAIPGASDYKEYEEYEAAEREKNKRNNRNNNDEEENEDGEIALEGEDPYANFLAKYTHVKYDITFVLEKPVEEGEEEFKRFSKETIVDISAETTTEGGDK